MKPSKITTLLIALGLSTSIASAADLVIGVPNWPSVAITAEVLKTIIEDQYGLEVELQNGTNPVVFQAMDSGSMQVHPEVWIPNMQTLSETYINKKKNSPKKS